MDSDTFNRYRCLLSQALAYSSAKTADDGMLLNSYNLAGFFGSCNNKVLIQRLDGMDIDHFCIDSVCCKLLSCFKSRCNAICELLALRKPNLLIPLSANASRGDQILNARSFERQGFSMVLEEEELTKESLLEAVRKLYNDRSRFMDAMRDSNQQNSIDTIIDLIENSRR